MRNLGLGDGIRRRSARQGQEPLAQARVAVGVFQLAVEIVARGKVQQFILENILPRMGEPAVKGAETGADLAKQIDTFINNVNAAALGTIGFLALMYTSISLLNSIEGVFNSTSSA